MSGLFNNKTIVILSPEDWGKNLLSKHLYALELSKNNTVYFIHTSAHNSQKDSVEVKKIDVNLFIVHLKSIPRGISKLPSFLIDLQTTYLIKKIKKKLALTKIDVVWSFDQSKFQNLQQFNATSTIFHPVDYIKKAQKFTSKIANSADVVLSVSNDILNSISTTTPKYFVNHGLDTLFLTPAKLENRPPYISNTCINVGYVGNLQMKLLDWDNLIKTVKENNHLNFIFIGPDKPSNIGGNVAFKELDVLKTLPNTHFTGELSKEQLTSVFPFIDIFWLCYNQNKFPIEVSNSHKILEYLSSGKVVVSNFISSYKNIPVLEMVNDNCDISAKIQSVAANISTLNANQLKNERINFASDNSYQKQIQRIEQILTSNK
ncbi:MAG: hypothetical protein H6587_12770 [Flavobacteriales bacterium]|nr:hypothetical protein [Flavobacteriales bacterium]MCB9365437.1 hypothetical protein [Flavobacteriales bacterium]